MDLSSKYLGFELSNPFILGSCPVSDNLDKAREMEDAGVAAIVMQSLFEEQLASEGLATADSMDTPADSFAEALSYFPNLDDFTLGPEEYLEQIRRLKAAVDVPIIASLNGTSAGGWLEYARLMEEAGADALELHIYSVPTDPLETGEAVERRTIEMAATLKREVKIPVAAKLSPFYTSFVNLAKRLDQINVDGMVVFNRFYQPDIDLENLEVVSSLKLSDSSELALRLRGLALLSGRVKASLSLTGGVHTVLDAAKGIMCGAHSIQLVSALYKHGAKYLKTLREGLVQWLDEHEYESLSQMRGSMSLMRAPNPNAFIRASYMHVLQTWQKA